LRTAIAALGGALALAGVGLDFLLAAGGGVAVGLVIAYVAAQVRRRIRDSVLDTALSLILPFGAYLAAEEIHASGVLAVVVTGLILGHKAPVIQNAASRISERTNWRTIQFLLENTVFLLIGLQVRSIVIEVGGSDLSLGRIIGTCALILLTVIILRPIWVFPATYLPRMLPAVRRADPPPPWQYPAVVSWAGMRGVVTLATVFVLPEDLPHRQVLVLAALVVTAGTLLLQGFTLPALVKVLGLRGPDPREDRLQEAALTQEAVEAGLAELEQISSPENPEYVLDRLRDRSSQRRHDAWERLGPHQRETETPSALYARLRLAMLTAERSRVLELRDRGHFPDEVLRAVLEALDIEESVLEGVTEADGHPETEMAVAVRHSCEHLAAAPRTVEPQNPEGCGECLRQGMSWVHLRLCLGCGLVACCESSPGQHTLAHYRSTGHPVIRSFEPGENWRWCYPDAVLG
jgi:CPA1 family monovalent cation:H+ antiporter